MFGDDDDNDRDENEGGAGPSGTGSTSASRDDSRGDDDSQSGNATGEGIDNSSFGGSADTGGGGSDDGPLGGVGGLNQSNEELNDDMEDDFGSFSGGDFDTMRDDDLLEPGALAPNVLEGGDNRLTPEEQSDQRGRDDQENQLRAVAAAVSDTLPDTASKTAIAKKKKPVILGIPGNIGLRQNSLF